MALVQIEYSGYGGLARYAGLLLRETQPVLEESILLTAATVEPDIAVDLRCVRNIFRWNDSGGIWSNMSVAYAELASRRMALGWPNAMVLIHSGFGLGSYGRNVVEMIHDPRARPLGRSEKLGQLVQTNRRRRAEWLGYHGSATDLLRSSRLLTFQHPMGPASYRPQVCDLASWFGVDPVEEQFRVLAFGRSAEKAELRRAITKLSALKGPCIRVFAAHPSLPRSGEFRIGSVRLRTSDRRIPTGVLDALVRDSDGILVFHDGYRGSASGLLSIAAYHGVTALVSRDVDPGLVSGGPLVAVELGSSGAGDWKAERSEGPSLKSRQELQIRWRSDMADLVATFRDNLS